MQIVHTNRSVVLSIPLHQLHSNNAQCSNIVRFSALREGGMTAFLVRCDLELIDQLLRQGVLLTNFNISLRMNENI